MLENATNLTNATACVSVLEMLKEHLYPIIVLAVASIVAWGVIMFIKTRLQRKRAVGHVIDALNNFATTWEALRKNKRTNVKRDIIPVLESWAKIIRTTVMSVQATLTNIDFSKVLDIANQLDLIKKSFEKSGSVFYLTDIDVLAERARECV